ncbi:DUF6279 family lipoprotein [Pseudoduganella sp. SL102]|uniref:Lipoprotein n=1 Tax=Pseudoduganella albidiflava TaxID=321983 RepID=A0A411X631_9BURK|nr:MULTISPECIES: DUF6279 family lipoprotein [Pseudoduganella]QBI04364.1 hypothetical protein EYF70_28780 [Pseudoduganella albidiflava]WBS03075.1 DUF6279 family lipoprotein [Pseudoduganella sp. SL102]GGY26651.1 hypothetical protein GCM10007387_05850 [Pseudoduganella albidiflava]
MQTSSYRTWFLVALLALVAACSSLKLAYNNGDTLLYWWLDNYVDFDDEQSDQVKKDINDLFRWHRKTQLQDYVHVLQRAQQQLRGNPTPADLRADYDDIRARTQALLLKAAPDIADLALSLKPEQLAQMEKKFAKNNDKFRRENMKGDREDQNEFRYKKSMEQFELWFGSFSREQKEIIRKASDARPLDNAIWLDERMRRQRNVLALARRIMQEKPSREQAVAQIQSLIRESFARLDNSERKAFYEANTNASIGLVHTVIGIATPEQKAHAQKRMQGWINDFNTLAAEVK